jgi:N-hydroxyarylamine O-acetyltransferase
MDAFSRFGLDAYFARIGYDGERAPTMATLSAIVSAHTTYIPFENLDPLFARDVRLDLPSLEAKLVAGGRGGYCFEHNHLLRAALEALGFRTTGLAARVVWNAAPGSPVPPRTHMLVRVEVDGEPYLGDVGFGGNTPTAPLRLAVGDPQTTPHGRYRLVHLADHDGDLVEQVELDGEWRSLYRFDLVAQHPADYEVMNHYTATHPASRFRTSLVGARATADGRWALFNRQLTFYGLDGTVKRRVLHDASELRDVLEHDLLVSVPAHADLAAALDRLPAPDAT